MAAIVVVAGPAGLRARVPEKPLEMGVARLWCRRAADVIDAAFDDPDVVEMSEAAARESLERAAAALGSIVLTDDQLFAKVAAVSAEITRQMRTGQGDGAMQSFNRAYREHRLKCESEGIAPGRYRDWLAQYHVDLVRAAASTLKYF